MATTLILYHTSRSAFPSVEWQLLPNKLFIVEDLPNYLATKTKTTINNFQYIKNELEIGINVDLTESYSQAKTSTSFKYVSIQNTGELIHYYFVKKATWRSKTCVRFELVMDVLNTFQEGNDYIFKDNTKITREHKDRFISGESNKIKITFGDVLSGAGEFNVGDYVSLVNNDEEEILYGSIVSKVLREGDNLLLGFVIDVLEGGTHEEILSAIQDNINLSFGIFANEENYIWFVTTMSRVSFLRELYRNIDLISEGINPVLKHNSSSIINDDKSLLRQDWYLLYRNQNDPTDSLVNPVECYLIPKNETNVDSGVITSGRITASSLIYGRYYYARIYEENLVGVELISQSITLPDGTTFDGADDDRFRYGTYLEITRGTNNTINLIVYKYYNDTQIIGVYFDLDYIQLNNIPFKYVVENSKHTSGFYLNSMWNNEEEWTNTSASNKLFDVDQLDKTDAKNIKLIKLPYCPYDFTITDGKIAVNNDENWDYTFFQQSNNIDFFALKLHKLNTKLEQTIKTSTQPFKKLFIGEVAPLTNDLRKPITDDLESKLYHSDFYQASYVYDSFSINIDLEKCNMDYYIGNVHTTGNINIKFNMTSTINSKFMFTIVSYESNKAETNFYKVLPIARNNEEVLYNVPYINYIRTGFNYDIKAKNISNTSNLLGLGLSAGSLAVSLAMPSAPLKVAGVVASIVSMAMSVKTAVVSAIQNENSIKQKIMQSQNQASSVVGSDDVDLMSEYCGNRLRYFVYTPNDSMKSLLFDLFFYAGYRSERMGVPTHNNRSNFDYLECDASLEAVATIPDECMTELINAFKNGVTYIHKNDSRASEKWDLRQRYENWENSLLEEGD